MRDLRAGAFMAMLCGLVALALLMRPGYFADTGFLGKLIIAQFMLLALARYKEVFFPLLLLAFLWAGIDLPFRVSLLYARWVVLGVGALVGMAIYLKDRHHHFGTFHLVALFCTLSAIVSALVSAFPRESILKAFSLLMLFVYAGAGARLAIPPFQPERFFAKLLAGCELFNAFTAIGYLLFRWQFFGNPNSLGAVMGIVVLPVMLWGFIAAERESQRRRLATGLIFCGVLLLSSLARAAIGAAAVSVVFLCFGLRQYRLLAKVVAFSVVLAVVASVVVPPPSDETQVTDSKPLSATSLYTTFLYKGHAENDVLASRRSVWRETLDVIKANPWFGSGFGTSITQDDTSRPGFSDSHIDSWIVREHGNSYLAIAEWVGLLGVLPFYVLAGLAALNVRKVFVCMRRTGEAFPSAIPAAAIIVAGLVHAGFEDWMFAVGYYVSVFYWAMAFILVDLVRDRAAYSSDLSVIPEPQLQTVLRTAS